MRLDRLVTLRVMEPLLRKGWIARKPGIPILMYHSISDEVERGVHPYYQTTTTPRRFADHMRYLHENGYHVVSLGHAVDLLRNGQDLDRRNVVLTFDDGFRDFYTEAFPILRQYGFPATVFLPVAFIDDPGSTFKNRQCLTWDQVRELHAMGVEFGSHSLTHSDLSALESDELETEIALSKKRIQLHLGQEIQSFCYPFAFPDGFTEFTKQLKELLHGTGYRYGVTTRIGFADRHEDFMFMKRIPVNQSDDLDFLHAKLVGAYAWIYPFQVYLKRMRRLVTAPKRCLLAGLLTLP